MENIKTKAIKSVKWTVFGEVVSRAIQPVTTLILAKLLTPEDFGVVGVAIIAIGLAQIFQDFGLGKTLIQVEADVEKVANIVFWTNIFLSLFIYLIVFMSAPIIANFFSDDRIIHVLRVLCLQIVLISFITVQQALLQREFQFKKLFFIRFISSFIQGVVAIPMALIGYGIWSLVIGTLIGIIAQILLYWKVSVWRPKFSFDLNLSKKIYKFSGWVFMESLLSWLILWGDSIILGHFLGVDELGIYRVGVAFVMLIFGVFFNPLVPIAYSTFSRFQGNKEELKQIFIKANRMIAAISLPLGVGLAVIAQPISLILFGQKWEGIETVIIFIGLMNSIVWLVGINLEVYRAIGRPDVNSKLLLLAVIYYLPVYIFAAPYGLFVFCLARFTVAIISMALHVYVTNKVINLKLTYLLDIIKEPLIGSIIMASLMFFITNIIVVNSINSIEGWVKIFGVIITGIVTYVIFFWFFSKETVFQFMRLVKEGIK